ncbi:MAG: CoA transferase [Firmicutes bacterium]|nr:CoA transferase [Bacillota bacterium]
MTKILDGIRVIDFTTGHMGTFATMLLADYGAEVIKIEDPAVGGDSLRYTYPKNEDGSAYHAYLNRGKKSICIDRHTEKGQELLKKLINTADVVCDCFVSGELEMCHLGYDEMSIVNPRIIYASQTGFGKYGPMATNSGVDLTSEALAGLMQITGYPDTGPTAHGSRMADQFGGVHLAAGICCALIAREDSGQGQVVEVASADSMLTALEDTIAAASLKGKSFHREGNGSRAIAPYDVFEVKDGIIATAISTNSQWNNFLTAMNMEYLHDDPRFANNESRGVYYYTEEGNPNGLHELLTEAFLRMTKKECNDLFSPLNIPSGPGLTVAEAYEDEQLKARNMVLEIKDKAIGPIKMMGMPIKITGVDDMDFTSAPLLGENTAEYLKTVGVDVKTMQALVSENVIRFHGGDE